MKARFSLRSSESVAGQIVLLLLCFSVIPMLVLTGSFFVLGFSTYRQKMMADQHKAMERISQEIDSQLKAATIGIRRLADGIAPHERETREAERIMLQFLFRENQFEEVALLTPEGKTACRASRHHTNILGEQNAIRLDAAFQQAIDGNVAFGPVGISPYSRFPLLRIYAPIAGPLHGVQAVLSADINVSMMWRLIGSDFTSEDLDAYMVDSEGCLIASQDLSAVLEHRSMRSIESVKRFLAKDFEPHDYVGVLGGKVVGMASAIPLTGWGLIVETPHSIAYAPFRLMWKIFGAVSLAIIVIATAFGLRYSSVKLIRPIRALREDVQILATGDLNHHIAIGRTDELGQLAADLTIMAENLRGATVAKEALLRENAERMKTEAALRENERKLKDIIDFLPDATLAINADKKVIIWNRAIEQMTGTPAEEMLGKGEHLYTKPFYGKARGQLMDLIWEDSERVKACYPFVKCEGSALITETFCPALYGGRGAHVYAKASPLHDEAGNIVGAIESIRDVTAQKEADSRLHMLAAIVEQSAEGVLVTDPNGTIVFVNPAYERITGYQGSELLEKNPRMLKSGEHGDDYYTDLWQTIRSGRVWRNRMTNRRKNGASYIEECIISPIRDSAGAIRFFVAVKRDVTELLKVEEKLRQGQKLEAVGAMAGGIAHDFNNILTPIIGGVELALKNGSLPDILQENLRQALNAAFRARDLIRQIVAFSRQGQEQPRSLIEMGDVVNEALKLLRGFLPSTIEIRAKIENGSALADATHIHQVLINLCTNAVHAMNNKGVLDVSLTRVALSESELDNLSLYEMKPGEFLKLSVSDTGCGMDDKTLQRIFDPYFTTKEVGQGSGLGLAVVHGIIKRCEGAVSVLSEIGKGSTFDVYFPKIETEIQKPEQPLLDLPTGSERVLVVDDERVLVDLNTQILEELGYHVVGKTNAVEALEAFRANPDAFDLVITDYTMPLLTGVELASEILHIRPETPVILCTGYSAKLTEEEAGKIGVTAIVMKPLDMVQMAELVRKTLDAAKRQARGGEASS